MESMKDETLHAFALELSKEDMKGKRLGEETVNSVLRDQKEFIAWLGRKKYSMAKMGNAELLEYHRLLCGTPSKRTGEKLAPTTINGRFYNVRYLFTLLYREGLLEENPAQHLELDLPEGSFIRRQPFSQEAIQTFLEHLDPSTPQGLRDRTMFELMYSSGLRVTEVAHLKVKDMDFERREMIVRGKYGTDRVLPISQVAKDFLLLFLGERIEAGENWIFPGCRGGKPGVGLKSTSVSERFRTLMRRYNMDRPEISAHSIRHSTATHLLDNGASIRHVQELLGHKNIETTVRYTHLQTDSLFKVYQKYHPEEHELFDAIDGAYFSRVENLLAEVPR
jgi:integrase/recombinase XerD